MGYLRLFLAVSVTISHLWIPQILGGVPVFGFFCLSGFIITKIIHETYGSTLTGKLYFIINRTLRIYPTYYLCLIIGILCILLTGNLSYRMHPSLLFPRNLSEWLPQLFIFGSAGYPLFPVLVMPTTWSLNVELVYYLVMCLLIGTSYSRCLAWWLFSLGISTYLIGHHADFKYHYFTLYGPSLCFASGALAYHLQSKIPTPLLISTRSALALGSSLAFIPFFLGLDLYKDAKGCENYYLYLYAVIPIFTYVIICLERRGKYNRFEQLAADISYPVFLLHLPIGAVFTLKLKFRTFIFWMLSTGTTLTASYLVTLLTRHYFATVRSQVRSKAKLTK